MPKWRNRMAHRLAATAVEPLALSATPLRKELFLEPPSQVRRRFAVGVCCEEVAGATHSQPTYSVTAGLEGMLVLLTPASGDACNTNKRDRLNRDSARIGIHNHHHH